MVDNENGELNDEIVNQILLQDFYEIFQTISRNM